MEMGQVALQIRSPVLRKQGGARPLALFSSLEVHSRKKPSLSRPPCARYFWTRIEAASSLGSTSSIDFEEDELLARTLPETSDDTASTSGQAGHNGTAESAAASSSSMEGAHSTAPPPPRLQNGDGAWKLRFPLPRWKQKKPARLVRQAVRLPPPTVLPGTRQQPTAAPPPRPAVTRSLSRAQSSSFRKASGWGPLAWLQQRFGQESTTDYVRIDFRAASRQMVNPFQPSSWPKLDVDVGTFWGLLVLSLAYVHHSTTGSGHCLSFIIRTMLTYPCKTPDGTGAARLRLCAAAGSRCQRCCR